MSDPRETSQQSYIGILECGEMKCNQVLFDKTMFNSSFMSYYYDITVEAEKAKGVFRDISIV